MLPLTNAATHPASMPNPMMFADQYHYRVRWFDEEQAFVGRVPSSVGHLPVRKE